jgi:hypothetical protein
MISFFICVNPTQDTAMNFRLLLCFVLSTGAVLADPAILETTAAFHGTSTLHDFEGTGNALPAEADWTPTEKGGVLNAEAIVFNVKTLTTDHPKRDKNMMKMFDPAHHPRITGSIQNWNLGGADPEMSHSLQLKIQDKVLDVPVTITSLRTDESAIHLSCHFSLSLKACGLKRPSVLGLIRVGDQVTVTVDTLILPGPLSSE